MNTVWKLAIDADAFSLIACVLVLCNQSFTYTRIHIPLACSRASAAAMHLVNI